MEYGGISYLTLKAIIVLCRTYYYILIMSLSIIIFPKVSNFFGTLYYRLILSS